ncbi:MAG TPA: DUF1697 domain-containing protein [Segeticoccus sp.]|nr:DUF1697 domain-containing protein [Segeticoccus sp.]
MTGKRQAGNTQRRWAAMLRGVNVGGRHRVPMAELRELAAGLGHADVATHLNSGNLLLTSDRGEDELARELEAALADRFGFDVDVVVRSGQELAEAVAANPFPEGDPKQVQVVFLSGRVVPGAAARVAELATAAERFQLAPRHAYIDFAGGLARSRLAAALDRALGVPATSRNVRTVAALAEKAGS